MTIFFTADTHFGHEKAITYHWNDKKIRPWISVIDQDRELIDNWNSIISKDDTVYHIGDVCDTSVVNMGDCLDKLNGKKIFSTTLSEYLSKLWNKKVTNDMIKNIWSGKTKLFKVDFNEESPISYDKYCELINDK